MTPSSIAARRDSRRDCDRQANFVKRPGFATNRRARRSAGDESAWLAIPGDHHASPSLPNVAQAVFVVDLLRYLLSAQASSGSSSRSFATGSPATPNSRCRTAAEANPPRAPLLDVDGADLRRQRRHGVASGPGRAPCASTREWPSTDGSWWWTSLVLMWRTTPRFYWTHRLLHDRRWFSVVHGRHRLPASDALGGIQLPSDRGLDQAAFLPLFVASVPTHTGVIAVFLLHMILRNAIGHQQP
mgnify:CR=1 FL=1